MNANSFPLILASSNKPTLKQRQQTVLYNCEVEYFARVLTTLENTFGRENVTITKYFGNPKNLTKPGHAHICIKKHTAFSLRTDMHYITNNCQNARIETMGGIFDEQACNDKTDCGIRYYRTANDLVEAIQNTPTWETYFFGWVASLI